MFFGAQLLRITATTALQVVRNQHVLSRAVAPALPVFALHSWRGRRLFSGDSKQPAAPEDGTGRPTARERAPVPPVVAREKQKGLLVRRVSDAIKRLPGATVDLTKNILKATGRGLILMVRDPREFMRRSAHAKENVKDMLHHYWLGSKLLAADVRITYRLLKKVLKGNSLTRRERKQLQTTSADLFRLVPFAMFVIIPFMELLLPVALKVFPNMLPSTFEDKLKKEENMKKQLKAKIEIAKFLQDTIADMAAEIQQTKDTEVQKTAKELREFLNKLRYGETVSNEELLKFSTLFKDEITLDNLPRPQLVAMCSYMGLSTYGGDAILRFQLRKRLSMLKSDDRLIHWEGVNSLSLEELQSACGARGMRSIGISKASLRKQMQEWLELSLNQSVPISLLILSRAFMITQEIPGKPSSTQDSALLTAIGAMPDEVVSEVLKEEHTDEMRKKQLEKLKRQEELIAEEEELVASAKSTQQPKEEPKEEEVVGRSEQEEEIEPAKIKEISEAVSVMASDSGVKQEREELLELETEFSELQNVIRTLEESGEKSVEGLDNRLRSMLDKLEREIVHCDEKIGKNLNLIDQDRDGVVTVEELQSVVSVLKDMRVESSVVNNILKKLDSDGDGKVVIKELERAIQKKLDDEDVILQSVTDKKST